VDILKAAFDDSFIAQIIVAPDGKILKANHQACLLLLLEPAEIVKLNHKDMVADEVAEVLSGLPEKMEANNIENWQTEHRYTRSDKTVIWADVKVSAVRANKKVMALLLQIQDISAQKRAEEDLQRNSVDLEQFVYIASHDLREPLIAVAGFVSLLKKRYGDRLDEQGIHFINEVLDSAKRMETKIDDLLAFSRAGRFNLSSTPFPLGASIEEAKRALVRRIQDENVTFDVPSNLPMIMGDRSMLSQVFQNLFSNSIKYKGAEPPRIKISAKPYDDNFWLIKVQDNGLGFDMQHKDRIFQVFQRLYTVEQYPGTGIGLAIAKKIVERHRGRIWAFSEPGNGSIFFFTLPAVIQP
jgi:PAS domain S-box-containing protein